jgi:hypothetical protein
MNQSSLCTEMGMIARKTVENLYNPHIHYKKVNTLLENLHKVAV